MGGVHDTILLLTGLFGIKDKLANFVDQLSAFTFRAIECGQGPKAVSGAPRMVEGLVVGIRQRKCCF